MFQTQRSDVVIESDQDRRAPNRSDSIVPKSSQQPNVSKIYLCIHDGAKLVVNRTGKLLKKISSSIESSKESKSFNETSNDDQR